MLFARGGILYTPAAGGKYMINLLIFAVISEIPYDLAFGHKLIDVGEQNVNVDIITRSDNDVFCRKMGIQFCSKNGTRIFLQDLLRLYWKQTIAYGEYY